MLDSMMLARWAVRAKDYSMLEDVACKTLAWGDTGGERSLYREYIQLLLRRIHSLESQVDSIREAGGEQLREARSGGV